ncbi:MAG: DNA polymerase III subunit delta' [Bacteroidota bacterium]
MQFQELIGQDAAGQRVREALQHDRLAHAIMLTGPSGLGKLAFANAIAQYVNCLNPTENDSCGKCSSCVKIRKAIHPDLRFVLPIISKTEGGKRYLTQDYFAQFREPFVADPYFSFSQWQRTLGGESKQLFISVHEIRELKRNVFLKAFEAKYKVVIVWQAELINREGANAFLKLLEEPPDKTLIIMTCSDPSRLLTTINSRCQRIPLSRIPQADIQHYLIKQEVSSEAAEEIAAISEGSIGNAKEYLSESSQAISATYAEWMRSVYTGDYAKILAQTETIFKESKEFQKLFLQIAIKKMRDSLLYYLQTPELALATQKEKAFQERFSQIVDPEKVARITAEMEKSRRSLSGNGNPQMIFTALSLRMHSIIRS